MMHGEKRTFLAALIVAYLAAITAQTYFVAQLSTLPTAQSSASGSVEVNVVEAPAEGVIACGNGAVEPGEECDDGNVRSGDQCSATCEIEPPLPSVVTPQPLPTPSITCFDGRKNGGETDVDCGGSFCRKCAVTEQCIVNPDCESDYCRAGACTPVETPRIAVPAPVVVAVPVAILEAIFRVFELLFQFLASLFA
jgi:cysteine-rich repeat protein